MKAQKLGILSAITASVCCLGPLLLVLLGLGGLGLGAVLGRYHWWFILAGMGLLTFAWRSYLKERRRCATARCEMAQGKTTKTMLTLASAVVAFFVGVNLYTYAGQQRHTWTPSRAASSNNLTAVTIPVEGMTCFTCELTVESSLKGLPGVQSADARVKDAAAYVSYDSTQLSVDDLIVAINKTGYKATRPAQGGS